MQIVKKVLVQKMKTSKDNVFCISFHIFLFKMVFEMSKKMGDDFYLFSFLGTIVEGGSQV